MDLSTRFSQLNQDCRDACRCARNTVITGSIYWDRETRVYTLERLGRDPFGFGRTK